ncbi:MAG TPA: helix-turn-helix domain-containing protein [Mycobacteriales bacterium]|nr:helix-turn-helix domain-containing protein [Mycobacteriales bacterium]
MEKDSPVEHPLRADAARNRERILRAAADVFADRGADAPLDEIARRAGVGNATLYRRFPDRDALIYAVAIDVLARGTAAARAALDEEPDGFSALARYMRDALQSRIGAVMPAVVRAIGPPSKEFRELRDEGAEALGAILDRARKDGTLREGVSFGDIGPLLSRLSRPMPNRIPDDLDRRLAARQLQIALDGMRAFPGQEPLAGPELSLQDLRAGGRSSASPEEKS